MKLPDFSNLSVGQLRYIQSIHESEERQNPDTMVWRFVPLLERWRSALLHRKILARFRANPFYYYVVARTKYYDEVFLGAIESGVQQIINIGCGSDTRPYRFERVLRKNHVRVLECDQREVISTKQRIVSRWSHFPHVEYLSLDLNDASWPEFVSYLAENVGGKVLVLMEGVSPYVNDIAFVRFLLLLSSCLEGGSRVAYDFKLSGVHDGFGRVDRTSVPFRLIGEREAIVHFHENIGYQVEHCEWSCDLFKRFLPSLADSVAGAFQEDGLVQLVVRG